MPASPPFRFKSFIIGSLTEAARLSVRLFSVRRGSRWLKPKSVSCFLAAAGPQPEGLVSPLRPSLMRPGRPNLRLFLPQSLFHVHRRAIGSNIKALSQEFGKREHVLCLTKWSPRQPAVVPNPIRCTIFLICVGRERTLFLFLCFFLLGISGPLITLGPVLSQGSLPAPGPAGSPFCSCLGHLVS